ncbi:MAG: ATP-dependent Clp protease proteolytic subunit [Planctomycetota bacterium]
MDEIDLRDHPLRGPARWIAAAMVVGVVIAGILLLVVILAVGNFFRSAEQGPTLSDLHSEFTDQNIDAGYEEMAVLADDPLLDRRKIVLGHDVNARTAKDVIARLLYLSNVDPEAPIDLYLTTLGGWGDNAFAIIDAMQMIEAPVNTWAVGVCYSSGAMILTAGTGQRHATSNTIIMVHANSIESDEEFSVDTLDTQRYHKLWRDYAHLPEEWFPMVNDDEYYLTAKQALTYGIIDQIMPAKTASERE